MDIDILLALQEFRNGAGSFLTEFFSKMTFLGEINTAIVIMAILYSWPSCTGASARSWVPIC